MSKSFVVISEIYAVGDNEFEGEMDLRDARKISKDHLKVGLLRTSSFPQLVRSEIENGEKHPEFLLLGFPEKTTTVRKRSRTAGKPEAHDEM
jgi:hypothetical protein